MKEKNYLILDDEPTDPSHADPARYMRRLLDHEIAVVWPARNKKSRSEQLRALLIHRFGKQLGEAIELKSKELESALLDAFAKLGWSPLNLPSGRIFRIPWDEEQARYWLREKLRSEWPANLKVEFLSADLHTLWTACRALELARPRDYKIADDPFPAPPILLLGPTGTGKELLAQAIHLKSGLKSELFGALNCGGLSEQLLESELFGYVKGAFTGAEKNKPGFVGAYQTLFLDEVGDMPLPIQVRLLRFLNSGEYRPVGSVESQTAHPRVIAATHVDLEEKIKSKEFREDLYYRLRGNVLRLRPLVEQGSLLPALFLEFSQAEAEKRGIEGPQELTHEARNALMVYPWPGNMRELRYHVEAILNTQARVVRLEHLADEVVHTYRQRMSSDGQDLLHLVSHSDLGGDARLLALRAEWLMNERYQQHLEEWTKNQSAAAQLADFLEDLSEKLGLSSQVENVVPALRATASAEAVQTFKIRWLGILSDATNQWHTDYSVALQTCEEALTTLEAREQSRHDELMRKAQGAAISQPLQAALLSTLPLLNHLVQGEEGLVALFVSFIRRILSNVSSMADLIARLDGLSQEDVMEHLSDFVDFSATKPSWESLRDDPDALQAFVDTCETKKAAAEQLGVSPRTVSRVLKKREKKES